MNKLEMYLVNIWCKLDDTYCALNKLAMSAELEDNDLIDKLRVRARSMAIEVDNKRDFIMHELGYNDYDKFVEYLETSKKAVWNKVVGKWEIPYEVYI